MRSILPQPSRPGAGRPCLREGFSKRRGLKQQLKRAGLSAAGPTTRAALAPSAQAADLTCWHLRTPAQLVQTEAERGE